MNPWVISAGVLVGAALLTGLILQLLTASFWRVGRRLKMINRDEKPTRQEPNPFERNAHFPPVASVLDRVGRYSTLERSLNRAGLNWQPDEYATAWGAAGLALAIVGWLLLGPLAAAAGIILALAGGWMTLSMLQARRLRQFEGQLADALMMIASSLRSGYGLLRSMQAIRDEMKPPISVEFAKVLDETAVGLGVPEALTNLVQRVPLPDLEIAVTAILIQLDVGGNLAEVIEIVAATVRERQRIRAEVDTLTAEGKLSGIILFFLPIAMAFIIAFLNPTYMAALIQTPMGHLLILGAAVFQTIGGLVIKRMLEVDF
jgi:tight adherence protein B